MLKNVFAVVRRAQQIVMLFDDVRDVRKCWIEAARVAGVEGEEKRKKDQRAKRVSVRGDLPFSSPPILPRSF